MSLRSFVYQRMAGSVELRNIVSDRIIQGESMHQAPQYKPFLIYRFGNTSPDNEVRQARRQYFTVYVHDNSDPGDYMRIDEVEIILKKLFEGAYDKNERILEIRWLETSADMDDVQLGTIQRYLRFQIISATHYT